MLLHAFAGSGKTSTAAEFGRWYALTGGVEGPVLFTSFEQYLPLSRVLDKLGQVFQKELEHSGIYWLTLDDTQRREVALQVLAQIPILWIWDNIEPVSGFPDGEAKRWSRAEQKQLADFLRDSRETKSKFLLTSRREEKEWLAGIPYRIQVPHMPMLERVQLARAISSKYGHHQTNSEDWRILLEYTQGNPLTITVVVGQVLRNGYKDKNQIEAFVASLDAGREKLEDSENNGRDNSLVASLNYGFKFGFNEDDLPKLALLHLFRKYVDTDIFCSIVNSSSEKILPNSHNFSMEDGIALLSEAAEIGILQKNKIKVLDYFGDNENLYEIHPALPQHFDNLFRHYYCSAQNRLDQYVIDSFIESVSNFAEAFEHMYFVGIKAVIGTFKVQEENLLAAVRLSCQHRKWIQLENLLRNLQYFYESVERKNDWFHLLEEVLDLSNDFLSKDDLPSAIKDIKYDLFSYKAEVALNVENNLDKAITLQDLTIKERWKQASELLKLPVDSITYAQRNTIRSLGVALEKYASLLANKNDASCIDFYQEALDIYEHISDQNAQSVITRSIGNAYFQMPDLYDLDQAIYWYEKSLNLTENIDMLGQAQAFYSIANVYSHKFMAILRADKSEQEVLDLANRALEKYEEALGLLRSLPLIGHPLPVRDLGIIYNGIGCIYGNLGQFDEALPYYQESIQSFEEAEVYHGATMVRYNVALDLSRYPEIGRLEESLLYAESALREALKHGIHTKDLVERSQNLICEIQEKIENSSLD